MNLFSTLYRECWVRAATSLAYLFLRQFPPWSHLKLSKGSNKCSCKHQRTASRLNYQRAPQHNWEIIEKSGNNTAINNWQQEAESRAAVTTVERYLSASHYTPRFLQRIIIIKPIIGNAFPAIYPPPLYLHPRAYNAFHSRICHVNFPNWYRDYWSN